MLGLMPGPAARSGILIRASTLLVCVAIAASFAANGSTPDAPAPAPATTASMISDLGLRVASAPVRERSGWHPPRVILVAPAFPGDLPRLQQVAPEARFNEVSAGAPAAELAGADAAIGI